MNQLMRNLAIARALEQEHILEKAWFGLWAHEDRPDMAGLWRDWQNMLPDDDRNGAPLLPASEIVRIGEANGLEDWADYMRARYLIGRGASQLTNSSTDWGVNGGAIMYLEDGSNVG